MGLEGYLCKKGRPAMSNDREIRSLVPEDFDNPLNWPDTQTANAVMVKLFEHFQKHLVVVRSKLGHARTATQQSMEELKNITSDNESQDFPDIARFDDLWNVLIKDFEHAGLTEKELEQIERVLSMIPDMIRRYYDVLVMQDRILQSLMTELERPEYQQAIELTRKVQSRVCRLSGLEPAAFEPSPDQVPSALTQYEVVMYQPAPRTKH